MAAPIEFSQRNLAERVHLSPGELVYMLLEGIPEDLSNSYLKRVTKISKSAISE